MSAEEDPMAFGKAAILTAAAVAFGGFLIGLKLGGSFGFALGLALAGGMLGLFLGSVASYLVSLAKK